MGEMTEEEFIDWLDKISFAGYYSESETYRAYSYRN